MTLGTYGHAMLDKMADNDHIKLYNIDIKVYVLLQDLPFSRYRVTENWISTKCPQNDLKHLTDKSYPVHTEYSYQSPKFHPILLYDQAFSRYKIIKDRKCTEWPRNHRKYLSVKSTLYTLTAEAQISLRFALQTTIFEIQACQSEMHRMTPEWPYALNCQKLPVCTEHLWWTMVNKNSLKIRNSKLQKSAYWK